MSSRQIFSHNFSPFVLEMLSVICDWYSGGCTACAVGHNLVLLVWKTIIQGELMH